MKRVLIAASAVLTLLGAAGPGFAQRTTGMVVGTVTDNSGGVLPGVTVTLKGEGVVGTQTDTSNEKGFYRFALLPPGTYTVTFSLTGFATVKRDVRVSVGNTAEENTQLKISQLAEEITVQGEAPVVDTQSNEVGTTYDKDWVRNAPVRRFSFFDLINAAPGVSQSTNGGFSNAESTSYGSGADENSYQLDGTDFTAPLTGEAWPYPNTDAIEEIEVLSLGAPAEYGNMQGAVFNVVTRQGSNEFHGDANFYYMSQGLTSDNTKDIQIVNPNTGESLGFADACPTDADPNRRCPYHRNKYNDFSIQLSGPIMKDKLWFFGSFQRQRDFRAQPGVDPAFPVKEEADRVFGKINWQINTKNKVQFAYHDDYYKLPFQATALTAPSSIQLEHGHNPSPGVTFTSVLSDKTYIEARYSGFYGKDHADPLNGGPRVNPRFYNLDTGQITGGIYYWYDGDVWKSAVSAKLSHFADNFLGGSHDFKFGVQFNTGGSDYASGPNDYIYTYNYNGYEYGYGYHQLPYHYGGIMKSVGAYFDDTYRLNSRLSLTLGLRFDHSSARIQSFDILDPQGNPTGEMSPPVNDLYAWNVFSPRIGFNFKVTGDGKTVLRGHYGRYYRGIITGEFSRVGPSIQPRQLGTYNFETGQLEDLVTVTQPGNLIVDPNYKDPYTDQYIVSFERELLRDFGLSLNYVHKRSKNYGAWQEIRGVYEPITFLDDQGADATGRSLTLQRLVSDPEGRLFQITNPPGMSTRINAFTVQLTKRMSNRWQMVGSFVYQKARGRLPSSINDLESAQRGGLRNAFGQNPNDFVNTDDLLIQDRPVVAKLQLVYEFPHGFLLGANFLHQTGRPWARLLDQNSVSEAVNIPATQVLAEPINGDRRVPTWNVLDLRLQKEFTLKNQVRLAVFAQALNLLNDDANESVLSRIGTSDTFAQPSLFLDPRRLMIGAKFEF